MQLCCYMGWVLTPLRSMLIFSELFLDKEEGEAVHDVELGDDEVEGVAGQPGGGQAQGEAQAGALVTRQRGGGDPDCLPDPVLMLLVSLVTPGQGRGQDEEEDWTLRTTLESSST